MGLYRVGSFCVLFCSFNIMFLRLVHIVCVGNPFFSVSEQYPCDGDNMFIHLPISTHLGGFKILENFDNVYVWDGLINNKYTETPEFQWLKDFILPMQAVTSSTLVRN